jgi:xanthine dehydrogenase small subunit
VSITYTAARPRGYTRSPSRVSFMDATRDHLLLYVNGRRHEVRGALAFRSLSDFLRYDLQLAGTKVVCAEGDCGSCTVLLGRPTADGAGMRYATVCSCIQFLHQLDGTHIVTVEGLTPAGGGLNAVQEAMVQAQGTQCGFCTPGFVVSLCAMFDESARDGVQVNDARAACVGNLCRCTGYLPILEAAVAVDASTVRAINELFPPGEVAADLRRHAAQPVTIHAGDRLVHKPVTVEQAVAFKREHPDCVVVAGGTDVGVHVNKGLRDPNVVMSLSGLDELTQIGVDEAANAIVAGARASIADLERVGRDALPEFGRLLYYFGSPPIKNAGTVGGNIVNGSPIGDTMPAMFVLNAEVELAGSPDGGAVEWRRVNINDFYTGYRRSAMRPDEIVTRVVIPLPAHDEIFRLYKVSRRKDLDISAFTAAIWMRRAAPGSDTIADARLAFGGVGPVILRLPKTESFLRGKTLTEATAREAGGIARDEVTPITDVRGSADYRRQLAENILRKLQAELMPGANGDGYRGGNGDGNGNGTPFPRRELLVPSPGTPGEG